MKMLNQIRKFINRCRAFGLVEALHWVLAPAKDEFQKAIGVAIRTGMFDRDWYVANNSDVDFGKIDPLSHFCTIGWRQYRDPSEKFSVAGYLGGYFDVLAVGMNPLDHYIRRGCEEGRSRFSCGPFQPDPPSWRDGWCGRRSGSVPFFSVVVASYNYQYLVIETLMSLLAQSYRNFEIVIVDDGSSDFSRENIETFIRHHAESGIQIRLITHAGKANRGLAATVVRGITESHGEYIAFCESDDLWTPDHLQELAAFILKYPTANVIVNDVDIFGDPVRVARFERHRVARLAKLRKTRNRITPTEFRKSNYILTFSCVTVKRNLLMSRDYHPVARPAALDWWLWRQICFDNDIYFINKRLTRWRMHDSYMFKVHSGKRAKTQEELQVEFTSGLDRLLLRQHPLSVLRYLKWRLFAMKRPSYHMSLLRKVKFVLDRIVGRCEYGRSIAANHGKVRILVCLHLFYEDSWPIIRHYLDNLKPYGFDMIVTCPEGRISSGLVKSVCKHYPSCKVQEMPNAGYDIGSFVESLRAIDLGSYDIVFKLQSKGVRRPFLYIYDQIFKKADWFYNLYDGILGGRTVHQVVQQLMSGRAKLAAASNLIVADPKHKASFVEQRCRGMGLPYVGKYHFVAGTCFAARAEVFCPLQRLALTIADFAEAKVGEFSLAHFLERWMCFPAEGHMLGTSVKVNDYFVELTRYRRQSALRLLEDERFVIDYDYFYRLLETRPVFSYEVVQVRLGDIVRQWCDGKLYPLNACAPYRYLQGREGDYVEYCHQNKSLSGFDMSVTRFESLRKSMDRYDPRMMPVVVGRRNIIHDGQHRCCILLDKFGPDYRINVLRIFI